MYGWEIVWPDPIGSAASSYARRRRLGGTNASRGTRSIASRTLVSAMSRPRSCSSTILRSRISGCAGIRRSLDPEVPEDERRDAGDLPRRFLGAHGEHGDERVAVQQRAVRAAARVVAAAEIGELDAPRRGDEHVAGVRARERPARTDPPAVGICTEPELAAVPQGDGGAVFMNRAM